MAGFFGIPIKFNPADGKDQMILAPEGQNPSEVIIETPKAHYEVYRKRKIVGELKLLWENASFSPIGSLLLSAFFPFTYSRLLLLGMFPRTEQKITKFFKHSYLPDVETEFKIPFTIEQSAGLLARTFKNIGNHKSFAKIIIILGHGAKSNNNPYFNSYNCGACGGRQGGPNARLLAKLANNIEVRKVLKDHYSIIIPEDTIFIGGLHNTTSDTVKYFDIDSLSADLKDSFSKVKDSIDRALGKNALERCHKFLRANNIKTPQEALDHVLFRSFDSGEVRPELNHATNAGVIVGRRSLTKGKFFDRRVFLTSYDPFSDDDRGTNLEYALTPSLIVGSGVNLEYLFSTIDGEHHGAGTKVPLNIVGNIGVTQGTAGDLRTGLPSQMTEMHTPIRSLFVVDAPIERIEAVLNRNKRLLNLVRNEWVKMCIRDPYTGVIYKQSNGVYTKVESFNIIHDDFPAFTEHNIYGLNIIKKENLLFWIANLGMISSFVVPLCLFYGSSLNPLSYSIAFGGTALSLPVLAFGRRYLHGEYMFGRMAFLSTGLILGFNLVALAPNLHTIILGWGLFGFASTFLIGLYNERPSVRRNAIFAFGVYRISDFALLVAAAFLHHNPIEPTIQYPIVAAALLVAAIFKSSQFPLTALFVRSMEGPTPCSALGYAGLSAHVGIVLLTSTMPLWFIFEWARIFLGSLGILTAINSTLESKIRSDRKGALANATSGTIGLIYLTLALGYSNTALLMSFGHAAFRIIQVLNVPNKLKETQRLKAYTGRNPWPKIIPDWLYKICWFIKRIGTDMNLFEIINRGTRIIKYFKFLKFSRIQQWVVTIISIILAGIPSPLSNIIEEYLISILPTSPLLVGLIMGTQYILSILCIRFLFIIVLNQTRFKIPQKIKSNKNPFK